VSLRIGHGIDSHCLAAGRPLMLGCIAVDHDRGLAGHSDGDVAAHALASAVLNGANLGTLGEHFPSADERWRDISGSALLGAVAALLGSRGARLTSAAVVIVAEAPRVQAHLPAMAAALAAALDVPEGVVSVSATSTDGLGATGRGEGIAASAVVLIELAES
jgi:2-C-methyl-D-erythritol 2,4-cyclodiphosphate synthase